MGVPARIGVIGGGTMGAGIAQSFAQAGSSVVVIERDQGAAEAARARVADGVARAARREPSIDSETVLARVDTAVDYTRLRTMELVIEAVPELLALKEQALARAEAELGENAWLATNTSSLPVSDLATGLRRPERFCGLHFFNPVPRSALVEIVRAPRTSDELIDLAVGWTKALDKTAIVVADAPGFASSRLGLALALEAMRMLEEGVASAADIDAAMVLGYKHASGPLVTTDLVGLDVRLGIADHLAATLGERFAPPRILRDKVAAGELGRKTGRGFFDYSTDS